MIETGIIFDYGGTLDSNGVHWANIIWDAYQKEEILITETLFREAYVYAERYLAQNPVIRPHFNFHDLMEAKIAIEFEYLRKQRHALYEDESSIHSIANFCYQKAKETTAESKSTIQKLSEKYKMVLVSNFYGNIEAVLTDFGLIRYFPKIIESSVVGVRKPNPMIFQLGIKALNLEATETIVIGDSYNKDIVPAKHCGCQTIWIKGKGWDPENETLTQAADFTFSQFKDIESVLL